MVREKIINDYLEYLKYQKNYSDYTCKNYYEDLKEYNSFLNIEHIKYDEINYKLCLNYLSYLNNNKNSKSTISRKLSSLRTFYKYLVFQNNTNFVLEIQLDLISLYFRFL